MSKNSKKRIIKQLDKLERCHIDIIIPALFFILLIGVGTYFDILAFDLPLNMFLNSNDGISLLRAAYCLRHTIRDGVIWTPPERLFDIVMDALLNIVFILCIPCDDALCLIYVFINFYLWLCRFGFPLIYLYVYKLIIHRIKMHD